MNLIDRYILEVGRHLPRKNRQDLQAEIRTLIDDMLADQYPDTQPDEAQVASILSQLGKPQKVAASYQPERYLIGPRLYPTFMTILQIVLAAVSGSLLLSFGLSYVLETETHNTVELFQRSLHALPDFITALFMTFGSLVIVFTVMDRWFGIGSKIEAEDDWTPADLPELEEESYNPVMSGIGLAFLSILAVFLNFFPHLLGAFIKINGDWVFTPLLSENFIKLMPYINIGIGLNIALTILVLSQGGWKTWSSRLKLVGGIYDFFILLMVIRNRPLIDFNPVFTSNFDFSAQQLAQFQELYNILDFSIVLAFSVAAIVIGIMWVIDLIRKLSRGALTIPLRKEG